MNDLIRSMTVYQELITINSTQHQGQSVYIIGSG